MDTHKFINFIIVVSIGFIILEIIFLIFIKQYLNKFGYSNWFKWILGLSIFFTLTVFYFYFVECNSILPECIDYALYSLTLTWFLPKILLVPFFTLKYILTKIIGKTNTFLKNKFNVKYTFYLLPYIFVLYSSLFTTYNLELDKKVLKIKDLPINLNNLKIIHISDFHIRNVYNKSYFKKMVELVNSQKPDLIFITGDYINFEFSEIHQIEKYLKNLKSNYGIYSCNGNHEYYQISIHKKEFKKLLYKLGIIHLINENVQIFINNYQIQIAGIDDINSKHNYGKVSKTLEMIDSTKFTILLAHNPDIWKDSILYKTNIALTLSGHTHGGQYGIKFNDFTLTPILLLHNHISGLYSQNEQFLHITDGIGTSGAPIRFGINPKVSLLILRRQDV